MVKIQKSRWDYIGLKSELNDPKFFDQHDVDGTTFLAVNTSEVYIRYNDQWYKLN